MQHKEYDIEIGNDIILVSASNFETEKKTETNKSLPILNCTHDDTRVMIYT